MNEESTKSFQDSLFKALNLFNYHQWYEAHDALTCIGEKNFIDDKNRYKLSDQHFLKKQEEIARIYSDMRMLDNFSKKWSIAGKSEIIEINKKLGCSIPEGADYHSLAGFLLEKFQMVPKIGDVLDFNNMKFEVISMSGPKIDRVKIILSKS